MTKEDIQKVLEQFVEEDGTFDLEKASEALMAGIQPFLDELEKLKEETGHTEEAKKDPFDEILAKYQK